MLKSDSSQPSCETLSKDARQILTHPAPSGEQPQRGAFQLPKDVPIARKSNQQSTAPCWNRSESSSLYYAGEVRKKIVGPMPVDSFLDEFLPSERTLPMPDARRAFNGVPRDPGEICDIIKPLVKAIGTSNRCPSVKFLDTSYMPSRSSREPDVTGYSVDDVELLERDENGNIVANMGLAEIFFHVLVDHDPFCDDHDHDAPSEGDFKRSLITYENYEAWDDKPARRAKRNLGYMALYAAEACARQHRRFYFSVLIFGTRARLFRWDRAGTIVTEAFDYRQRPEVLCKFLWRFHLASQIERGFDPTVTVASQEEERLFKGLISDEVAFQLNIDPNDTQKLEEALKRHYQEGKVSKIKVYDSAETQSEDHLVSVPVRSPTSAAGCCTRGYWSVKLTAGTGEVVFLKDTWRVEFASGTSEGTIYEDIQGKVENIPELQTHGSVLDETYAITHSERRDGILEPWDGDCGTEHKLTQMTDCTRTQEFVRANWVCECLRRNPTDESADLSRRTTTHTHYRLILKEVGYPLSEFTGSRELFEAANDALEALVSAYEQCGRLHRDVSLGNIILVRSKKAKHRKGYLIDWELSTPVGEDGKVTDRCRTGTWAFMSGPALTDGWYDFRHTKEDDMESLFYVVLYASLRWLRHSSRVRLGRWMYDFFDESFEMDGRCFGGSSKRDCMGSHGRTFRCLFEFENPRIHAWFPEAYKLLGTRTYTMTGSSLELLWTFENLRDLFRSICRDLSMMEGAMNDKVQNSIRYHPDEDRPLYHNPISCSTCISISTVRMDSDAAPRGRKRKYGQANEDVGSSQSRSSEGRRRNTNTKRKCVQEPSTHIKAAGPATTTRIRQISGTTAVAERIPRSRSSRQRDAAPSNTSGRGQRPKILWNQGLRCNPSRGAINLRRSARLAQLPRPVYAL